MVRLLLDSHVVLWWLMDDHRLGARARAAISDANEVAISVATPWELGIKQRLGKLELPDDFVAAIAGDDFRLLPIELEHVVAAAALPLHHRDPFDRVLVAQARSDALTLVSADRSFRAYDAELLDAAA